MEKFYDNLYKVDWISRNFVSTDQSRGLSIICTALIIFLELFSFWKESLNLLILYVTFEARSSIKKARKEKAQRRRKTKGRGELLRGITRTSSLTWTVRRSHTVNFYKVTVISTLLVILMSPASSNLLWEGANGSKTPKKHTEEKSRDAWWSPVANK